MEGKIKEILSEVSGVSLTELRDDTRLVGDLGMNSFDLADTVVSVEETYGVKIPQTALKVQQKVKQAVESMTGLSVRSINVTVSGVSFDKENKGE